jgi:nucleoside-diphosphate-sugar epimerase
MQRPWQFHPYADHVARLSGLLDSWVGRGLRMLIVPGSAEEYGQRGGRLREEDPPAGWLSPYGWGKWSVQMLLRCWSAQTGIPVVWLRPFIVYGPGQTGNMVLPYAVRQVQVGAAAELSDGTQQRDFVFIDDVVEAFHAAMQLPPAGFQAINLGSGTPIRVRDVLEYLGQLLGAGDRFQFGARPRRAGEPEMQVADPSRAAAVLGWSARVAWREGVEQVAAWARRGEPWAA